MHPPQLSPLSLFPICYLRFAIGHPHFAPRPSAFCFLLSAFCFLFSKRHRNQPLRLLQLLPRALDTNRMTNPRHPMPWPQPEPHRQYRPPHPLPAPRAIHITRRRPPNLPYPGFDHLPLAIGHFPRHLQLRIQHRPRRQHHRHHDQRPPPPAQNHQRRFHALIASRFALLALIPSKSDSNLFSTASNAASSSSPSGISRIESACANGSSSSSVAMALPKLKVSCSPPLPSRFWSLRFA